MLLRKTFRFEASHILPEHPGKCSRLHGHSWVLHVFVEGDINPKTGFVMDFADLSHYTKAVVESLDHHHLGAWPTIEYECIGLYYDRTWAVEWLPEEFYPSSENLLHAIGARLGKFWSKLALEETCTSYAELTREEFNATRNQS
jgi:queuosine biosynthesis protein QueD